MRNAHRGKTSARQKIGKQPLPSDLAAARRDSLHCANALRNNERRRETGRSQLCISAEQMGFLPTSSAALPAQKPFIDARLAAQSQLLGRPGAGRLERGRKRFEPPAKFSKRPVVDRGDARSWHERGGKSAHGIASEAASEPDRRWCGFPPLPRRASKGKQEQRSTQHWKRVADAVIDRAALDGSNFGKQRPFGLQRQAAQN